MSSRKKNDERRFNFCLRCLRSAAEVGPLIEHHTRGRRSRPAAVVFICRACNTFVEDGRGPVEAESRILEQKKALLMTSAALRFVVEHRDRFAQGFLADNRNGPSFVFGVGFTGPLGAIGFSGRRYFLVPPEFADGFVVEPTEPTPGEDGVGGAGGGGPWRRFKGGTDNILNRFLDVHASHGSLGARCDDLRQD